MPLASMATTTSRPSARDAAGNVGPAGDLQITIDTVAPAVSAQLAKDSGVSATRMASLR
jgi:hypothetical protein